MPRSHPVGAYDSGGRFFPSNKIPNQNLVATAVNKRSFSFGEPMHIAVVMTFFCVGCPKVGCGVGGQVSYKRSKKAHKGERPLSPRSSIHLILTGLMMGPAAVFEKRAGFRGLMHPTFVDSVPSQVRSGQVRTGPAWWWPGLGHSTGAVDPIV